MTWIVFTVHISILSKTLIKMPLSQTEIVARARNTTPVVISQLSLYSEVSLLKVPASLYQKQPNGWKKDMDGFIELHIKSNTCKERAAGGKCDTFET